VQENLRWNFMANVLDIGIFTFGINLVSQTTIMPLLISHLTTSKMAIGLLPAIISIGYLLPQLLLANYTEGLRRKKSFVMMAGIGERIPFVLIGVAVWAFAGPAPTLALAAVLVLRGIGALSGGIATPAWYDLVAKVIPTNRRGLYSGVGNSLGALLGIAGAEIAGRILGGWPYPDNFALCFIVAFGILSISLGAFVLNREPDSPTVKHRMALADYLGALPAVLRRDHNYRRYLISRSVVVIGSMATGFYVVYGAERFGMAEKNVGTLTALLVGSQAVANLLWGQVGDRFGHKRVLLGEAILLSLTAGVAFLARSPIWLGATFVILGFASAAGAVSALNIILEFCVPEDRPTYIGLTNTIFAPVAALAPLLGGWLATWVGYREMFAVACLTALIGGVLLALWVREPRRAWHRRTAMTPVDAGPVSQAPAD
jgi:MFS family permease